MRIAQSFETEFMDFSSWSMWMCVHEIVIHGIELGYYIHACRISDIDEHTRTAHRRTHAHCTSTNTRALHIDEHHENNLYFLYSKQECMDLNGNLISTKVASR